MLAGASAGFEKGQNVGVAGQRRMPVVRVQSPRVDRSFGSHLDVERACRGVEFLRLFGNGLNVKSFALSPSLTTKPFPASFGIADDPGVADFAIHCAVAREQSIETPELQGEKRVLGHFDGEND